jgi:sulfoxide reductase heme-binding subunit YedZ
VLTYDLIRACGLVAYLVLSVSVALGIASVAGDVTDRAIDRRLVVQLVHRSAAVVGLVALAAHLTLVVLDTYVATPLSAVLVPFTSGYQPFALGLGSLAMYGLVLAAASGWLRVALARHISERGWRRLHRSAYVAWALCLTHGILAGPDRAQPWAIAAYAGGVLALLAGLAVRAAGARHVLRRDVDGAFHFRAAR